VLIEAVGQFAGTFISPFAVLMLMGLLVFTRRPLALRLAVLPVGAVTAIDHLLWPVSVADAAAHLAAASAAVLLQVELVLQVAIPVLDFVCRLLRLPFRARPIGSPPPRA
jgi:hypothetical protein